MILVVLRDIGRAPDLPRDHVVIPIADLRREVLSGRGIRHFLRYRESRMLTRRLEWMPKPFTSRLILRLSSRGSCYFEDLEGRTERVTWRSIIRSGLRLSRDAIDKKAFLRDARGRLAALHRPVAPPELEPSRPPVYVRTDLWFGWTAGGAVAHTAGVLNGLVDLGFTPVFVSAEEVPTIDPQVEEHRTPPPDRFLDFSELPTLAINPICVATAVQALGPRRPSFVYQRYALNGYAGLELARKWEVPYVCEFNGSEIWMAENWGVRLRHADLARMVEEANLTGADLVVVVSRAMADQALGLGVPIERLLVNPNGVDPDVYCPDRDGSTVRERYGFGDRFVIGFIGTFGPWHGAEVLAEAFGRLISKHPELRSRARLLMVGDGVRMSQARDALHRNGVAELAVLTGLVPQQEGPDHLAACDVFASPHVPNPDGTPFFGSPTKLFEYMAMGRAIAASDLEQIGEVLEHGRTALLVKPGNSEALAEALHLLIVDPTLRRRLGDAAREQAIAEHTWTGHVQRILEALRRCTS